MSRDYEEAAQASYDDARESRIKRDEDVRAGLSRTLAGMDESVEELDSAIARLFDRLDYLLTPDEPRATSGEVAALRDPGSPVRQHADRVHAHVRQLLHRVTALTERIDL